MENLNYTWLYTLSGYEFGNSAINITKYIEYAKSLGYISLGLVGTNTYGYPEFFKECKKNEIKPVVGYSLSITFENLTKNYVLFLENDLGYENLCKIISNKKESYNLNELIDFQNGISFVLPFSELNKENFDYELSYLLKVSKLVNHFYIGNDKKNNSNNNIYNELKNRSYKLIVFPKCLHLKKEDSILIDVLKSNQNRIPLINIGALNTNSEDYLLTIDELKKAYTQDEIDETNSFVENIDFDLFSKKRGSLTLYSGNIENDIEIFKSKVYEGLKNKKLNSNITYAKRVDKEIKVIVEMGFASYFLIVSDYINYAKENDIKVGPGRGSACGSLVSYLLDITEIDPIEYNLSFERFLNTKRITMPDIDVDFQDDKREEIIAYLTKRYGEQNIAQIITFSTYKIKSAIKAAGFALSIPQPRLTTLLNNIPLYDGDTIDKAIKNSESFKNLCNDQYYSKIIEIAKGIEGLPSNTSIHASGVILSNKEIFKECPMTNGKTGLTSYEYQYLEELGFLKVDLLSLHYLTIIKKIEDLIKDNKKEIPIYQDKINDEKTYKTINDLKLLFVFQLDGENIKNAIKEIIPTTFKDLIALLALFRPGPMANIKDYAKRKESNIIPSYHNEKLDNILKDTYGIIIYQEQILSIAHEIAGLDLNDADMFRRAISKKDHEKIEKYKQQFLSGSIKNGLSEKEALTIYNLILKFADYGFNKSHSVAYSLITFTVAYLKTHYPLEFYSVIKKEVSTKSLDFKKFCIELNYFGYKVKPININYSQYEDIFIGSDYYLGFNRTSAISQNLAEAIVKARNNSKFNSLADFLIRVSEFTNIDSTSIDLLSSSGALDELIINRDDITNKKEALESFSKYAIEGMEDDMPELNNIRPSLNEICRQFVRELNINDCSLSFDLKKYIKFLKPKYNYGVVTSIIRNSNYIKLEIAQKFGTLQFITYENVNINKYDLITFKVEEKTKNYYVIQDISTIKE